MDEEEQGLIQELAAQREITELIRQGKALDLLHCYYTCTMCDGYLFDIVKHVADEGTTLSAQDFARNLLDDWTK